MHVHIIKMNRIGKWVKSEEVEGFGKKMRLTNRYRFMYPEEGDNYIELELPSGEIVKCYLEAEKYLKRYHWNMHKTHGVRTIITKDKVRKSIYLRRLVIKAKDSNAVTHINGDQLDYRKENLEIKRQIVREDLKQVPEKVEIYYPEVISASSWRGGKPAGCISRIRGTHFTVRFSSPTLYQPFYFSDYESEEECRKVAEAFRYEEADRRGLVRNKIRRVTLSNGENVSNSN